MGAAKVNIRGFLLTTSGASGWVRVGGGNVNKAKGGVEDGGPFYAHQHVLQARVGNVPGHWNGLLESSQQKMLSDNREGFQNDQSCSKFLIWKKRSVFT